MTSELPIVHRALVALGKDFWLGNGGDPQTEQEWLESYAEVVESTYGTTSTNPKDWTVTWAEIEAKIAELNAAE